MKHQESGNYFKSREWIDYMGSFKISGSQGKPELLKSSIPSTSFPALTESIDNQVEVVQNDLKTSTEPQARTLAEDIIHCWKTDPNLSLEFDSFGDYISYREAVASGRVKERAQSKPAPKVAAAASSPLVSIEQRAK